ncbi:MAG: hypothetical protein NDI93_01025 [Pseudomonas sp.]|nr:hypothetical protein [Pseudomonas sp.]
MTIVAFHYTKDSFFAIADGLISRGPVRVLEQTKKIIQINPEYKIPRVSLGRLNGFSRYVGGTFCICFAGNFSIISSVIEKFNEIVSRKLVLDRDKKGTPTIYQREDEGQGLRGGSYWDNYNFSQEELIPITINFLMNILERVALSVCSDFSRNAMQNPDIELILFGTQIVAHKRENFAQIFTCKELSNGTPLFHRHSVLPWRLACIGDASIIPELTATIESDPSFDIVNEEQKNLPYEEWATDSAKKHRIESDRISAIKTNILRTVQRGTQTIGGDCTIASSGWANELSIKTIKHDEIDRELDSQIINT